VILLTVVKKKGTKENTTDRGFYLPGKVRFYEARFSGRKEGIGGTCKAVRNVGTSSPVYVTERIRRKLGIGRIRKGFSCN